MNFALIFSGSITGILIGLTGVGGGAIMTPLLLLVFGIAPTTAVGTDLWFAALTKSAAVVAHRESGLIDWQVVRRLWLGSLPGAALTVLAMKLGYIVADVNALKFAIGVAVLLTASGMLFQRQLQALGRRFRLDHSERFLRMQPALTTLAGCGLGLLVSLTSIGAGAIGAVILAYLYPLRMTPAKLVATDIAHAIPLALVAGLGHILIGHFDWRLLLQLLAGSIPGVLLGVWLARRLPPAWVKLALMACLLGVGGKLVLA